MYITRKRLAAGVLYETMRDFHWKCQCELVIGTCKVNAATDAKAKSVVEILKLI